MWPYTDEELAYLDRIAAETSLNPTPAYTPELADYYIARARTMRALMLGLAIGRGLAKLRSWLTGRPQAARPAPASDDFLRLVTDRLRTPLTTIRASSEILRDNPDLTIEQRNRFLDSVLEQNAQLERLIGRMLAVSRFEPAGKHWEIDADDLAGDLFTGRQAHG